MCITNSVALTKDVDEMYVHANTYATVVPEDVMSTKVFVRRLWIDNYDEREKIRIMLNRLGFYVLTMPDGLEVNAIKSTPDGLVEWFKGLFGKE